MGEANRGLEYMFVMMNAARFAVGLEGVSLCERAYQRARDWARERLQGRPVGVAGAAKTAPIIQHPDVKRMLLTMKASAEATRALAYEVASLLDRSRKHPDEGERRRCQAIVDLLIPVVKGWSTETAIDVASLGIQVHGGMGFIEETGAAQHLRDARISTIYEGTTGIQANDLVGRKVGREAGVTMKGFIAEMRKVAAEASKQDDPQLRAIGKRLERAVADLERATEWIVTVFADRPGLGRRGLRLLPQGCGPDGRRLDDGPVGAPGHEAAGRGPGRRGIPARQAAHGALLRRASPAAGGLARRVDDLRRGAGEGCRRGAALTFVR